MNVADPNEAGKTRHAEDPTQCFVTENRLSLEKRLGIKMPYLGSVDQMLNARGTDGFDAARAEVEKKAKEAVGLKIAEDVLGREDLKDKGLEAVVAAEAREALKGVPVGSERRGPVIAQVLSDRAIEAETGVAKRLDDLVAEGRITDEQAETVSGYVAGELLRLAALAQEVNRMGEPRPEVMEAVRPIGGQIDSTNWNAEVWEGLVKAARGAGAQGETPREEAEDQAKSSGRQAEGESAGGKWWENPLVDKAVTLAMGILIEKGGDAADVWLKEWQEDRALKREMVKEGRPAGPAGPGRQAEAAPATPAVPVPAKEPAKSREEKPKEKAEDEGDKTNKLLERLAEVIEKRGEREDAKTVVIKSFVEAVKAEAVCSSCGAPRVFALPCPSCNRPSQAGAMLEAFPVLKGIIGEEEPRGSQKTGGARERLGPAPAQPPVPPEGEPEGNGLELPRDVEQQRHTVRRILDTLEASNRDLVMDYGNAPIVRALEVSLGEMDPSVAKEVRARLELYDSAFLIEKAGGWIENKTNPADTIAFKATEAMQRRHDLKRSTIETVLKEGLPGYRVADAWNLLQKVNLVGEYPQYAERAGFTLEEDTNYFSDKDISRKEAVRQMMLAELGGGKAAEKSLELANRLAVASLETSVWNRAAGAANDQLAEIIWLKEWREKRSEPGRIAGPPVHLGLIEGFGNSWLRTETSGDSGREMPLYVADVNYDGIRAGSWQYHCSVNVGRYNELRNLLIDEGPEPNKIKVTALKGMIQHFNTADKPKDGMKCGDKLLRVYWLLGVVDSALTYEELGWDRAALNDLEKAVVKDKLSDTAGTFISREQWEWIKKAANVGSRVVTLGVGRALRGHAASLGGGAGAGGKRK